MGGQWPQYIPTPGGTGEHHVYIVPFAGDPQDDVAPLRKDLHYVSVAAVGWYVNLQGGILSDRQASGTLGVEFDGRSHELALGLYELEEGAKAGTLADKPLITTRVYGGGPITLTAFIAAIERDALLGSLLRQMAEASLNVVSGSVAVAGPAGAILDAAGKSLVSGVKDILKGGKKQAPIFDAGGVTKGFNAMDIRGPDTYVLIHRGQALTPSDLSIVETPGTRERRLLYLGQSLQDGAWLLLRLRRSSQFEGQRPWSEEAKRVQGEIDDTISQWQTLGISQDEAKSRLQPKGSTPPTVGDKVQGVYALITADDALTLRERGIEKGVIRAVLLLAQQAAERNDPEYYWNRVDQLRADLEAGQVPTDRTAADALQAALKPILAPQPPADADALRAGGLAPGLENLLFMPTSFSAGQRRETAPDVGDAR